MFQDRKCKKSKPGSKDKLIEYEIDSNDTILPYLYNENSNDVERLEQSETTGKEPSEGKSESMNGDEGSESSNRMKTEVHLEYYSDDEVYVIEDEKYTIDQDGNWVKYDNKGNRMYVTANGMNKNMSSQKLQIKYNLEAPSTSGLEKRNVKRKGGGDNSSVVEKQTRYEVTMTKEDIYRSTEVFGNYVTEQLRLLRSEESLIIAQHKITKLLLELQEKQFEVRRRNEN